MVGRAHLSIGEVLSLLHDEFPDVTISKIRFLESQGLVDPERTPSGYRKFYEPDIERLRWVLRQQRDAFLPLKVIKGRLVKRAGPYDEEGGALGPGQAPDEVVIEEGYAGVELGKGLLSPNGGALGLGAGGAAPGPAGRASPAPGRTSPAGAARGGSRPAASGEGLNAGQLFDAGPPYSSYTGLAPETGAGSRPARAGKAGKAEGTRSSRQPSPAAPAGGSSGVGRPGPTKTSRPGRSRELRTPDDDELALAELVDQAGVDVETIRDLERYGLITPRVIGGASYYTHEAAVIARLAWAFARHGVEARHLKAYKGAAEREAGLVQQVIMPLIRQRNPQARQAAAQAVDELSELGGELRAALLRAALADLR